MALGKRKLEPEEKILDVDASMQGSLIFKDPVNLRINGRFEGKLDIKGRLTIGEHAIVNADIDGEDVTIAGSVRGNITAKKELRLIAPAHVKGDINTPVLSVQKGAILEGYCNMSSGAASDKRSEDILTIEEVAKFLEVDENVVSEWADAGKLPAIKEGSTWRFERSKIENWLANERVK